MTGSQTVQTHRWFWSFHVICWQEETDRKSPAWSFYVPSPWWRFTEAADKQNERQFQVKCSRSFTPVSAACKSNIRHVWFLLQCFIIKVQILIVTKVFVAALLLYSLFWSLHEGMFFTCISIRYNPSDFSQFALKHMNDAACDQCYYLRDCSRSADVSELDQHTVNANANRVKLMFSHLLFTV